MSFNFELYRLAELARHKLLQHASRTDHDLRSLVLHANLLDSLLLELNKPRPLAKVTTDRDHLPVLAAHHARLHGSSEPVILITEANADAEVEVGSEEEEEEEDHSIFLGLRASSPGSPPMLSHDADTDSDSSDSETEHDDFETESVSASPSVIKGSENEGSGLHEVVEEKETGLQLHRTISRWRLPLLSL